MKGKLIQDKYHIIRTLGKDNLSETYLARDKSRFTRDRYVIKKFRPILGNPQVEQIKRLFYQEASVLQRLDENHPQIPQLYECFMDGEDFYLVREWIKGITLEQKVQQEGVLSEAETKQILDSILRVLKYIHSYGIVYRQLKPSSILLRQQNWLERLNKQDYLPVPIYFGGVQELEKKTAKVFQTSVVLGRQKEYIPPEQKEGESVYASDLYSLGLTAIYLLTGKTPAELSLNSFSNKLLWRREAPNLETNLAWVIDRAICPNPSDRFTSAEEMLQALQTQPILISNLVVDQTPERSLITPEIKITSILFVLGFGTLGILFGLLNFDFGQFSGDNKTDDSGSESIDNESQSFKDSYSPGLMDVLNVPTFTVGTSTEQIIDSLGQPTKISRGYWGDSTALSYLELAPNDYALGYLSDRQTQKVRQTEITFTQSANLMTIQNAVEELLLDDYSSGIEHQINQIFFRTTNLHEFENDSLQGVIERNAQDGIYIGIWERGFHR